jgi:PHD/YefM family antitoxin component YafN of YafNO toxin-antitoxin module
VAVSPLRHYALVSELPAGDTQAVIRHRGQVVAVIVPIEEYQQLRQALQEQQVNEEFDAFRATTWPAVRAWQARC